MRLARSLQTFSLNAATNRWVWSAVMGVGIVAGCSTSRGERPIVPSSLPENFTGQASLQCTPVKIVDYLPWLKEPRAIQPEDETPRTLRLTFKNGTVTGYAPEFFTLLVDGDCTKENSSCTPKETRDLPNTYTFFDVHFSPTWGYSAIFAQQTPSHSTLQTRFGFKDNYLERHYSCITTKFTLQQSL